MPFNFYDTHTLLMAVQQLAPAATFLRDRYFPTYDASDIFSTEDVLVEYRDGVRKLAPFVAPRKGGVTILRKGYTMERYTPPFVAPRRTLTLDELRKRGFGEALYSQLTPEQRQQVLIVRDADELGDLITNREEAMAAETMLTSASIPSARVSGPMPGSTSSIRRTSPAVWTRIRPSASSSVSFSMSPCPAASRSGSCWPAPCAPPAPCCCWMSRLRGWTPRPRRCCTSASPA